MNEKEKILNQMGVFYELFKNSKSEKEKIRLKELIYLYQKILKNEKHRTT